MKNIFLFIAAVVLLASCKKEDQYSSREISVRYVVTANHISPNAHIERWKQFHSSNDFTDNVSSANSEKTIIETLYYAQCPEQIIFGARIVNGSPTDTIFTSIYVDGVLIATGARAGTNEYYQSEITTTVAWE